MESTNHIIVSDIVEMVNGVRQGRRKNRNDSKGDIAEYCADAIKNSLDCRYLAYRNDTIDKHMKEIEQQLHGRDVQGFVVGEPVTSLTGIQGVINNNHEGNITHIGEVTKLHGITCTCYIR